MKIDKNLKSFDVFREYPDEMYSIFKLAKQHSALPKRRTKNWHFVSTLTNNGSGYSATICEILGVDPDGYKWERKENEL